MEVYILKTAACMAFFLIFYTCLLENERMHEFKRFYLLGAIIASLVIPQIVFTTYITAVDTAHTPIITPALTETIAETTTPTAQIAAPINYKGIALMVYCIGTLLFGFRFLKHLFMMLKTIQKNSKHKIGTITHVLVQEKYSPHTFFKYIFLNKTTYQAKAYPKEVLLHEEIHAKQYHSLDVLVIEFLQVIFWFNPLVYFFKKAIKLNHEFLADAGVIAKNIDKTSYQNTLLSYVTANNHHKHEPHLANAINYSSIKKRFTIMKKNTSKKNRTLTKLICTAISSVITLWL